MNVQKVRIRRGYNAWYQTLIDTEGAKALGIKDGVRVSIVERDGDVIHVRRPDGPFGSVDAWVPDRFVEIYEVMS